MQTTQRLREFDNDILSRFCTLLDGDVLSPLMGTGLVEAALKDIRSGDLPADKFMGKLSLCTNANSHWLLTGKSSPLYISNFDYDDEMVVHLDELLAEDMAVFLINCKPEACIVLTIPTKTDVNGNFVDHLSITVLTGDVGPLTRQRLGEASATHQVKQVEMDQEKFELLKQGWLMLGAFR